MYVQTWVFSCFRVKLGRPVSLLTHTHTHTFPVDIFSQNWIKMHQSGSLFVQWKESYQYKWDKLIIPLHDFPLKLCICAQPLLNKYKCSFRFGKMLQTLTGAIADTLTEEDSYSMGNQSPQSSLTFSMSLWQRKRSWTSLRAVGDATSLIHTCRDMQRTQTGLVSSRDTKSDRKPTVKGSGWTKLSYAAIPTQKNQV